jgi:AcrR family transcriptional regulator
MRTRRRGGIGVSGQRDKSRRPPQDESASSESTRRATASASGPKRRLGREWATGKIIDAAAELFDERGFDRISVRDIAERAGVSHTLVHRYVGSREKILAAVMRRSDERLLESARGAVGLLDAALRMLCSDRESRVQHMRLVASVASSGLPLERLGLTFPTTRHLLHLAEETHAEFSERGEAWSVAPNVLVAGMVAMAIGWSTTRTWLPSVMSLDDPDGDLDALESLLAKACMQDRGYGRRQR